MHGFVKMKKRLCNRMVFLFVLLAPPGLRAAETIIVVADYWAPVNTAPESEAPGYAIEIAQHIFHNAGFDFEYRVVPWARALKEVQNGRYTAAIGATEKNAGELLLPERPFGVLENDFYTRTESAWTYAGVASLANERLGAILGYEYGEIHAYIRDNAHTLAVQLIGGANPLESNFKKLLANRITVLVEWAPVAEHMIRQNEWCDQIRHAGRGGNRTALYLGFHPNRNDLAEIWDRGFETMLADGSLDTILQRYGFSKTEIGF